MHLDARVRVRRLLLMLLCAVGFVALYHGTASAADFTVNNNGDANDAQPGNGTCATAGGVCTLRAAVQETDTLAGPDTITVPAMTISLGSLLTVAKTTEIRGAGARSTIVTGTPGHVLFRIDGGDVGISDLALQGASSATGGGGLAVYQTGNAATTLTRVRIADNKITGVPQAFGPIYLTAGEMAVRDSEISGNSTASSSGNAHGGAVYAIGASTRLNITNTTVHGNSVTSGSSSFGGGVFASSGSTVTIRSSTISKNTAANTVSVSATGGNIYVFNASMSLENSIVSEGASALANTANCSGMPTFIGRNIVSDTTCGLQSPSRTITDPLLAPLADNSGNTNTRLPVRTGPAVDAAAGCSTAADQRGQQRPIGPACDLGAAEVGADLTVSQSVSNAAPQPNSDVVLSVVARNLGLDDAPETVVQTVVSGASQVTSATTAQGNCSISDATVTCPLGTAKVATPVTILIVARAPQSGTMTATATLSSPLIDQNPGNNSATVTATVPGTLPTARACATAVNGTPKADRLRGGPAGDRIRGGGGNDVLRGLGGDDCLLGQVGNDRLLGGVGVDRLVGGKGKDRVSAGAGADVVRVRDGVRDVVKCGAGKDLVLADKSDRVAGDCERVRRK